MNSDIIKEKDASYASTAELGCSVCGGKILIGIPRSRLASSDNKLTEMPPMTDPRWELIVSSCLCEDE